MCLGARLGTSVRPLRARTFIPVLTPPSADGKANRGHLDTSARRRPIINHALTYLLLQALTISSIAGVVSFLLGLALNHRISGDGDGEAFPQGQVEGPHREGYTPPGGKEFPLVLGTAMSAACISSLILGSFMAWLVVACRWLGLDPDNIASPLAATLGDLLTLFIMALVGTLLVKTIDTPVPVVLVLLLVAGTAGIGWRLSVVAGRGAGEGSRVGREEMDGDNEQGGWSPLVSRPPRACS